MYRSGMGDYRYARSIIAGDPGIFGSIGHFLGTVARVAVPAIVGAVTGGPAGAVIGAVKGTTSAVRANVNRAVLASGGSQSALTPALRAAHARAIARGAATAPVGGSLAGTPHGRLTQVLSAGGGVSEGGGRRRRMNWANTRALGRAERRIHAAVKHMTKYIRWVHPAKHGHAVPKFKKRRAA